MSKDEKNKIYFISGVSGVGKTSTMAHLKNLLSHDFYDIRDLDERGVPDGGGLDWLKNETRYWLNVAKQNAVNNKNTIICGFANPELFREVSIPEEDMPAQLILLHASGEYLEQRLHDRHATPESIKEIERASGVTVDQFVKNNVEFAPKFRAIFEKYDFPIIDTDNRTPLDVAEIAVKIITNS